MTNPRMLERNRLWKRRLTALGIGTFVGLSALIGRQATQSQTAAAAASVAMSAPTTTTAITLPPPATSVASVPASTNTSSVASVLAPSYSPPIRVNTRTGSSR